MQSVAENKKSNNIAEYIIYMYQMEDLIRSYQGNREEIKIFVVEKYPVSDEDKDKIADWYLALLDQMETQGILEKGHLSELNSLVYELAQIHWNQLKTDPKYFMAYGKAKPFILEAVMQAGGQDLGNEIQICLNGVYGLLLCRLLGRKVSEEQLKSAEAYGDILSTLSYHYQVKDSISKN
ncbi:uncharacterized protein DUF4924 [Algoriphagus ratkowskyi]|uniref:DUF4924 family protein n=1 Tax=Algoriphagus ratkowskyi TaxID=57028 RepID=A0A2W7QSW1_9BACT|nr:DUF4924 family protein [Algoriphagus ratkowskyi]PZX51081.1 uncharacterized protein DUF4924 [Algoriphagus ratkowskyi]TXD75869.1 DUF4924 family protein [Algoriphagus ratkowskyi]